MGILSWISDAVSWLVDKILRPVVNWITEAINWVIDELRYWKHKAFELLAKWLENDWFFLGAVIATIAAAVMFPKILTFLSNLSIVGWMKGIWEAIKKGIASILDFIHILDLQLINNILKVFWPEWRSLMGQLSDVTSALFEELGQGAAYGHAYFSVIHSMAMLQHSFTGTPMELAEAQAFEETSNYLQKVNDRFRDYSHNPGNFARDIIEEIYIPYSETIQDAQQAELEEIRANRDHLVDVNRSVKTLSGTLENFIAIQPEETAAIVEKRLGPVADALTEITDAIDIHVLPKINEIVEAIAQRTADQEAINRRIIETMEDPFALLSQYERYGFEEKAEFEAYIAEIVGYGNEEQYEGVGAAFQRIEEGLTAGIEATFTPPSPVAAKAIPATRYEPPGSPPSSLKPGWFQGEY